MLSLIPASLGTPARGGNGPFGRDRRYVCGMARSIFLLFLLLLGGCAGLPPAVREPSQCDAGEATHACQVERYNNVNE